MKISKMICKTILDKLEDIYPLMLGSGGYADLTTVVGNENTLDGHLLYLNEKGLIRTVMDYDSSDSRWYVNPNQTRISALGLDYLDNNRVS